MLRPSRHFLLRTPRRKAFLGALLALFAVFAWAKWGPMDPLFSSPTSTVLLDRRGELITATVATDGQWRFPPGGAVPERFATCLVQFEDRRFHRHWGVRLPSLYRAWQQNRAAGRVVRGGSTITMQVARLSGGPGERTYWAKLKEILLALRLELRYSKAEILALHAGNAPFGGNVVGLEAAAWRWFGRPAQGLSWAESATLAVLPNAPAVIFPGKRQEALRTKRDRLLSRLLRIGAIDSIEWSLALEEPLPGTPHDLPRTAPHLLTTFRGQGRTGELLRTTLDAALQRRCTEAVDRYGERLRANEVHNAAALVMEVSTGRVLAYVGNLPSAGSDRAGEVDIIRARRSTGSLLKPFLFADMLQSGELLPRMLVADVPTRYEGFAPRNFDEQYNGAVPAEQALARSLNIPAVRALRQHGIERTLVTLRALGLRSIDCPADHYGLSLVVGGAESTLWELCGAYANMARILVDHGRGGVGYHADIVHPPIVLLADTVQPSDRPSEAPPPLSASAIHCTLQALADVARPAEEQGWSRFVGGQRISWKTGTSFGHRDAWAIGVTDRYAVAVWTGNASGEGRPGLTGTLAAAPLLFDLFALLPRGTGFEAPYDEMRRAVICRESGHRAGIDCVHADTTWIPPEGLRTAVCPYHRSIRVDATGSVRVPAGEGRLVPWFSLPPAMERYYALRVAGYRPLPPLRDGGSDEGPMEVLYPDRGAALLIPVRLDGTVGQAVIEVAHRDQRTTVHWDLDGDFMGSTVGDHRMALAPAEGAHILTLTDAQGRALRHPFRVVRGRASSSLPDAP
ncbi:MAG TPA: penicillin-binding protein 1C [Flavobacteriales bacterium]